MMLLVLVFGDDVKRKKGRGRGGGVMILGWRVLAMGLRIWRSSYCIFRYSFKEGKKGVPLLDHSGTLRTNSEKSDCWIS